MEILKRLGVAEGLREVGKSTLNRATVKDIIPDTTAGVDQHYSFDVNFSTGLSPGGELITRWVRLLE